MNALDICNGCDISKADPDSPAGYCVECEAEARSVTHLERRHGYQFGPQDDPLASPYAVDRLHAELHRRGDRHASIR